MEVTRKVTEQNILRTGYRPDIDGLRAVAVLLVLASHLRTRLAGGYVGVDVFFVISGYLISAHILKEMAEGRFSIVTFYERRVRRIFPAMLVMMAVVSALVYYFFVPFEVESYGRSLLAALFSGSNFLFWHEAGYFDTASTLKPLLHTWSLGVEEQFYIVFPLLLLVLRRWFPTRLRAAIFALAGLSLAAACVCVYVARDAAFFFAPLRAWELFAGTILSQHYLPIMRTERSRNVASAAGLLLIAASALLLTPVSPFPGLLAVPAVLGAALIIAGGETGLSLVGRVLSWRPVVFIGLISYSLYLWHWPLIVMQETSSLFFAGTIHTALQKLLIAVISILVGTLSWALVEQPFRKGRFKPSQAGVFTINGLALAAMTLLAAAMVLTKGMPGRFPPEAQRMAEFERNDQHAPFREGTCFLGPGYGFADFKPQTCMSQTGKPSLLILGDSHGAQLWLGMAAVFGADHDVLQANVAGCRPLLAKFDAGRQGPCAQMATYIYDEFLPQHHIDTVLLAGRWEAAEMPALKETIAALGRLGVVPVVLGPGLEYSMPQPRVIALAMRAGKPESIRSYQQAGPEALDTTMATLAATEWHVPYISYYEDLCKPQCPIYANDQPMLMDNDHLTPGGSELLARTIRARGQIR